jgi:hypothetical protein
MSAIKESTDVSSSGFSLTLSALSSSLVSALLGNGNKPAACFLYVGAVDGDGALIGTPYQVFAGHLSLAEFRNDGARHEVELNVVPKSSHKNTPNEFRYTKETQLLFDDTDQGFDYVNSLGDPIQWGKKGPKRRPNAKRRPS